MIMAASASDKSNRKEVINQAEINANAQAAL